MRSRYSPLLCENAGASMLFHAVGLQLWGGEHSEPGRKEAGVPRTTEGLNMLDSTRDTEV